MNNNAEIKTVIINRENLKAERERLGIDPGDLMKNPMSALSKMGDIQRAGEMSKDIESMSDEITQWAIQQINNQEQAVLTNG